MGRQVGLNSLVDQISPLAQETGQISADKFACQLFAEGSDGYFLCDTEGKLVEGNSIFKCFLGYSTENSVVGHNLCTLGAFTSAQSVYLAESLAKAKNGTPVFIEDFSISEQVVSIQIFRVQLWDNTWLLGVLQDMANKAHQTSLQSDEERYRIISELISDYAYSLYVDHTTSSPKVLLEWMMGGFEQMTGIPQNSSAVVNLWKTYIHPDDYLIVKQAFASAIQGHVRNFEARLLDKEGNYRWVRNYLKPIMVDGKVI